MALQSKGPLQVFGAAAAIILIAVTSIYLCARPNPGRADSEQYNVLSDYIASGLTGYSHDLGSRDGLVVILGRTTVTDMLLRKNRFNEYLVLVGSLPYARRNLHLTSQWPILNLPREGQILAKVIQEHLGLPHVHNALEFADVRGGEPYEVDGVSPMAHLRMHEAVEGMLDGGNADVKAAYEKLLATGIERHHAVHIVGAIFLGYYFYAARGMQRGAPSGKAERKFTRSLRKICTDSSFRRKMARRFSEQHGFAKPRNEEDTP